MTVRISPPAPDYDIAHTPTPTAMINRLLPMIPTDRTIANYVNSHFGGSITVERVAELRRLRGTSKPLDYGEPIANDNRKRTNKKDEEGCRKLFRAIRAAYPNGIPGQAA